MVVSFAMRTFWRNQHSLVESIDLPNGMKIMMGAFAWCTAPRANAHFPNIADRNVKRKKLNRKDVLAFWNVNLMPQKNRICLMYLFVCLSFSFVDALTAYMQLHSRVRTIYFTQAHRYISCHIDILRV